MQYCSYFLYESLLRQYPFYPTDNTEQIHMKRFAETKSSIENFPKDYRHIIFNLTDSMEVISHAKACHAFSLGLSFGLSIAQELESFQDP